MFISLDIVIIVFVSVAMTMFFIVFIAIGEYGEKYRDYGYEDGTSSITWHYYPDEEPTKEGLYIVTFIDSYGEYKVSAIDWRRRVFDNREVIAWAKMPEPHVRF